MLRVCAVLVAAVLVPGTASAKELKPKFGDIGGVYYTDVSENREACRQAIKNKIALCRQNTSFVSNTNDRKYPGCLPIFRQQAGVCADHFRSEAYKCQGAGTVRIEDFTGFACTVTATVVEEGGEPERGTGAGQGAGPEDGQTPQTRTSAAGPSPKCAGMARGGKCWLELTNKPGCHVFFPHYDPSTTVTWSGDCSGGIAVGRGTWGFKKTSGISGEGTGTMTRGRHHGRWVWRYNEGSTREESYVDGKKHGRSVLRHSSGGVTEDHYVDDKRHGLSIWRGANGKCFASRYTHGRRAGRRKPC